MILICGGKRYAEVQARVPSETPILMRGAMIEFHRQINAAWFLGQYTYNFKLWNWLKTHYMAFWLLSLPQSDIHGGRQRLMPFIIKGCVVKRMPFHIFISTPIRQSNASSVERHLYFSAGPHEPRHHLCLNKISAKHYLSSPFRQQF